MYVSQEYTKKKLRLHDIRIFLSCLFTHEAESPQQTLNSRMEQIILFVIFQVKLPWKKICTSVPFLIIMITHFCNNCCWYVLLTELPKYMSQVLYFKMEEASNVVTLLSYEPEMMDVYEHTDIYICTFIVELEPIHALATEHTTL
jgi:hypothetical protein